jgi:predicted nucleic acid-binding protein
LILVDAGPLVALIDRGEADHERCVEALSSLTAPMVTTWPALTEAMYLVGGAGGWKAQEALWRLLERGDLQLAPLDDPLQKRTRALMGKYRDTPMDLAFPDLPLEREKEVRSGSLSAPVKVGFAFEAIDQEACENRVSPSPLPPGVHLLSVAEVVHRVTREHPRCDESCHEPPSSRRTRPGHHRRAERHGVSPATYYQWKSKCGGLEASDLKRMEAPHPGWETISHSLAASGLPHAR